MSSIIPTLCKLQSSRSLMNIPELFNPYYNIGSFIVIVDESSVYHHFIRFI